MPILTVIIPSGGPGERFFKPTIEDVLVKGAGEVEVFAVTDGWVEPPENRVRDDRVTYLEMPDLPGNHKRDCINRAVELCAGEYVMALDAHCMVAEGWDEVLIRDHGGEDWISVPRRLRLDPEKWVLEEPHGRPPIDYEYPMWKPFLNDKGIHGYKWDSRTLERMGIPIDSTMEIQASTWMMRKSFFQRMGFMQVDGYTGWGQESEELVFGVWQAGGRVVTNKNTWYGHLHKGRTYGRMYNRNERERHASYDYSYQHWVIDNREWFVGYINHWMPLPNWPEDWERRVYGKD